MLSHFLSFILALALTPLASSLSVQIPLDSQYPPVAHVGQPYSWTISDKTFDFSSESTPPNYTVSPIPNWLSFNTSTGTFSGTPSETDQGTPGITVTAGNGERSTSTNCNILVTSNPAVTLNLPLSSQFYDGNPALSSAFPVSNDSALYTGNNTLRIPFSYSFCIGFSSETFKNPEDNVHYTVLQSDKSPVPYQIAFTSGPDTLCGTAPSLEQLNSTKTLHLELLALVSDSYTDGVASFDLSFATHDLSMPSKFLPTINMTENANSTIKFGSSADLTGVLVDGIPIDPSNISSISIDTSSCSWLEWDGARQVLTGNTDGQNFDAPPRLKVDIATTFDQTIHCILPLAYEPSFFTNETLPVFDIPDNGQVRLDIHQYLSNATGAQADVNMSIVVEPSSMASSLNFNTTSMVLSGSITDRSVSNISVTISAYSSVTDSTSHARLPMVRSLKKALHRPGSLSFAANKKLILGLSISFAIVGGLCALGTFLASVRRCLRVQDPVLATEACQRNLSDSDKRWYGLADEKGGQGSTTPSEPRSGMELLRSPRNYGNIGLGVDPLTKSRTKELISSSSVTGSNLQSPGVMKKGDFMTRIRETVRNVSDKFGSYSSRNTSPVRRGMIGKPILLNAHGCPALSRQHSSADPFLTGAGDVSTPASVHFADLTRQLSADSTNSLDSIRTHANEAVVQTATRYPSVPDSMPSRPRLKQVTSAMRVPAPKLVTSSPDCSEGSTSGSILNARVTSQKAKIWKGTEEDGVPSASGDELSMGIRYVTALGGDSSSTVDADIRPGSSYTVSTHLQSTYSLDTPDDDRSGAHRLIVRADERFEIFIPVGKAKKVEARMISGDNTPNWMNFDLRPKNGKIEVYGIASISDVGDWDVRVLDMEKGSLVVGEVGLQVVPRPK